jgi:hypothetical protein
LPARARLLDLQFLRHLHPEGERRKTLRAAELMPLAFRLRAWPAGSARLAPVTFRLGAPLAKAGGALLKVAVSLGPAGPFRLAAPPARTARVLQPAAVTFRAAAAPSRDRDVQRGPRRGAS